MTAPQPIPATAQRAVPFLLILCAALLVLALIESRSAAHSSEDTKAARDSVRVYEDSLKEQKKVVAASMRVRDSLADRAAKLERPAAVAAAKTDTAKESMKVAITAGEQLLADSAASLLEVRKRLHDTDSIATMLVARITAERFTRDSLHAADVAVMRQDMIVINQQKKEIADWSTLHDDDLKLLAKVQHGFLYRAGTGVLAVGGGALCGAGGWLLAGPAGAVVGAGACAGLISSLR